MILYEPDPKVLDYLKQIASEGIFVQKKLVVWKGIPRYQRGQVLYIPEFKASYMEKSEAIKKFYSRMFFFKSIKTESNFYFIPKQNIQSFSDDVDKLNAMLDEYRKYIVDNYDFVVESVKQMYAQVLHWRWVNDFKNSGTPPDSFIEKYTNIYIDRYVTKEIMERTTRLSVLQVERMVAPERVKFGNTEEINKKIIFSMFFSILIKRKYLLFYLQGKRARFVRKSEAIKKRPKLKVTNLYKSIARFSNLYMPAIFYGDKELLNMMESMRDNIILDPDRSIEKVIKMIDDILNHLVANKDYYLDRRYQISA